MKDLFFDRLAKIDAAISAGPASCNFTRDIAGNFREPASRAYFYRKLEDAGWLELLVKAGEFRSVPEGKEHPNKGAPPIPPPWPQAEFLARIARDVPDKVLDVLLRLPETNNFGVFEYFADAANAMPASLASKLVPRAKKWLVLTDVLLRHSESKQECNR